MHRLERIGLDVSFEKRDVADTCGAGIAPPVFEKAFAAVYREHGVLQAVGLKRNVDAIDLCCGDGWFTLETAKVARRVVAIDIDHIMLEVARDRLTKSGATNCEFVEGEAYKLPELGHRPADFVFMANAFHGVPDQLRLAQAVHKTLKPGGSFAVVNWHQRPSEEIDRSWRRRPVSNSEGRRDKR